MTLKLAAKSTQDAFEVLDISPEASPEEIQEAYLLLVATYAENSFASYTILSKEQRIAVLREVEAAYQSLRSRKRIAPRSAMKPAAPAEGTPRPAKTPARAIKPRFWERVYPALARLWPARAPSDPGRNNKRQANRQLTRNYRLTAGQHLKNVRTLKGLTLQSVSEATNIRVSYLRALEEGLYDELPTGVYRRLMLSAYAKSLNLSPESLLKDMP